MASAGLLIMQSPTSIYFGDIAAGYEDERVRDPIWQREDDVLTGALTAAFMPGDRVVDLAAGTGRWLSLYKALRVRPALVDVSADMLDIARGRAAALGLTLDEIVEGNVFTMATLPLGDWLVCTRFFNWISHASIDGVITRTVASGIRHVAFTARCLDPQASRSARLESVRYWRGKNQEVRAGTRKKGHYYLQSADRLERLLDRHGYSRVTTHVIERTRGDVYLLFVAVR